MKWLTDAIARLAKALAALLTKAMAVWALIHVGGKLKENERLAEEAKRVKAANEARYNAEFSDDPDPYLRDDD